MSPVSIYVIKQNYFQHAKRDQHLKHRSGKYFHHYYGFQDHCTLNLISQGVPVYQTFPTGIRKRTGMLVLEIVESSSTLLKRETGKRDKGLDHALEDRQRVTASLL